MPVGWGSGTAECAHGINRTREKASRRRVEEHCERFEQVYPERHGDRSGFQRPVIRGRGNVRFDCRGGKNPS